jgi:hypothetical protein
MRASHFAWSLLATLAIACDDDRLRPVGVTDAGVSRDAAVRDAAPRDAEGVDATADAETTDAVAADAEPVDAVAADATPAPDALAADAEPMDAIATDAAPMDALAPDAAPADATPADATPASPDAGVRPCVALQFDGLLDHVLIADSPSLNPTGPVTVEAWVRTESGVVNPPWYPNLISKRAANNIYPPWGLGIWENRQLYSVGDGAWVFGSTPITFGRWSHVAAVFDQAQVRFYVDGVPAGSTPAAAMGPANTEPVVLGTLTNNTQNFRGDMAGLRVSRVARYTAAFAPATSWTSDADTLLLLPMDEGVGATVGDRSGHGNDGAVNGAAWIAGCPP